MPEYITILGTAYRFTQQSEGDEPKLKDNYAIIDYYKKEIIINMELTAGVVEGKFEKSHLNRTIRHEVIHAFMFESGLSGYAYDETLVDWIAIQFPKLGELLTLMEVQN